MAPLVDAITWLAAPAELQIDELLRHGTASSAGELASAYDAAVRLVVGRRGCLLSTETLDLVEAIDDLFATMHGNPELWTLTALCEREEWRGVRRLAHRALAALRGGGAVALVPDDPSSSLRT